MGILDGKYRPDVSKLEREANIKGLIKELKDWYSSKQLGKRRMVPMQQNNR